ncbi:MAG: glutamine synthetase family protein [Minwuiales bacterium]|nr:glutamine synthetase family protein [Minwuiales bacterium]
MSDSRSVGSAGFVERFGLWRDGDAEAAERVARLIDEQELEVVRLSFADQHGVLRGKTLMADAAKAAMRDGCTMTTSLLAKDTSHKTVYPVFTAGGGFDMAEMSGAGDFVMVPDPATFRVLPWAPGTGWMLCDIYFPNGKAVPFSTRQVLRDALGDLADAGYDYVAGVEIEFHLLKLEDPKLRPEQAGQPGEPPSVSLLAQGFQYLTENRMDQLDPALEILRRHLVQLDLPLRSIEVEFGPSQCELTFHPGVGLEPADTMVLLRSAVKQVCRRHGYHATFMCRPNLPNLFSSGWHLHQSLRDRKTGENAFMSAADGEMLSPLGRHFVAGLLAHAPAASVFTTPTINGYKRYRPYTLAPDRAVWGRDNRGAMIRAIGGAGDGATRLENRIGEPAANPYLYLASQILSGMDGVARKLEPATPVDAPYEAEAPALPQSLMEAVQALRGSEMFREKLGDQFVDYIVTIKEFEISRFLSEVTDWEQREYFDLF